ncbi:MAG: hypothetical protein ACKOAY_02605 [Haliscomenobacter sp.]
MPTTCANDQHSIRHAMCFSHSRRAAGMWKRIYFAQNMRCTRSATRQVRYATDC